MIKGVIELLASQCKFFALFTVKPWSPQTPGPNNLQSNFATKENLKLLGGWREDIINFIQIQSVNGNNMVEQSATVP